MSARTWQLALPSTRPANVGPAHAYLVEVEALRGLAIALVFFCHADYILVPDAQSGMQVTIPFAFIRAGHTGVNLFFVLSGFLLSLPFMAEARGGPRLSRRTYLVRRALRILPLYYVAVFVGTVLSAHTPGDLRHGVPYLVFLNSFAGGATLLRPYSDVWWSLATEVQFYLVLPLVALLLRRRIGLWIGGGLLAGYVIAYAVFLTGGLPPRTIGAQLMLGLSLFGRAPLFLLGASAARFYDRSGKGLRERWRRVVWLRNGGADAAFVMLLVGLGMVLQWVVSRGLFGAEVRPYHLWHVLEGVLWTAVLLALLIAPLRLRPLFVNPALVTVGTLSYSVYLVHMPLLRFTLDGLGRLVPGSFAGWGPASAAAVCVLVVVCLSFARLTYTVIERPFLVRKARLR